MAKGIEKRKERRIRVSLPVKISYQRLELAGQTENISRLGAYIEIGKEIPMGAELEISLQIPGYDNKDSLSEDIKCRGSVFRSSVTREELAKKYYGLGIFFTDFLQQADKNKLSEYIDFLILQETKEVKEGLKRWKKKRDAAKKSVAQKQIKPPGFQEQALELLKNISGRLEEIYHIVKSQDKTK